MSVDPNHASAAEKKPSDRKQTTDDTSVSVSNYTDQKPEEAHGNGRDRTTEACAAVNPTHSTPTDGQIERRGTFLPRHNSEKEMEDCWKIHKKETDKEDQSEKEDTEYQHLETAQVVSHFDSLPDEIILQIFKRIEVRDRLRLEGVNSRWQRLLIVEFWNKDVRNLDVSEIFSRSFTDENIEFLRRRVAPFAKCLDFWGFGRRYWSEKEYKEVDKEVVADSAIARQMFSVLSSPPCALREIKFGPVILDRSTMLCLRGIRDQITSLEIHEPPPIEVGRSFFRGFAYHSWNLIRRIGVKIASFVVYIPKEPIEDTEEGGSNFESFTNLIRLKYRFPGVDHRKTYNSSDFDLKLPPSIQYLDLYCPACCGEDAEERLCFEHGEEALERFWSLEESFSSLRELSLNWFYVNDETIVSGLVVRFPDLEILKFACEGYLFSLELLAPLKNLRELYLQAPVIDFRFLSSAFSFEFRKQLEVLLMHCYDELIRSECLENLRYFPSLKDLTLRADYDLRELKEEKITKECKKLRRISLSGPWVSDGGLGMLGANCPDLQYLHVSFCREVTEEGVEMFLWGITNPKNLKINLYRTGVERNSDAMIRLMDTYGFTTEYMVP